MNPDSFESRHFPIWSHSNPDTWIWSLLKSEIFEVGHFWFRTPNLPILYRHFHTSKSVIVLLKGCYKSWSCLLYTALFKMHLSIETLRFALLSSMGHVTSIREDKSSLSLAYFLNNRNVLDFLCWSVTSFCRHCILPWDSLRKHFGLYCHNFFVGLRLLDLFFGSQKYPKYNIQSYKLLFRARFLGLIRRD